MPSLSEETNGRIERLMPGATIGIIGGGQLGRMMALSARYMGFRIGVLDPTPDCPAAQVADFQVTAEYDDIAAIRELAETMAKVVGFTGQVVFDSTKPDGTPRKLLDVSRLADLGWRYAISLEQGLAKTYQWFLANQDNFRK